MGKKQKKRHKFRTISSRRRVTSAVLVTGIDRFVKNQLKNLDDIILQGS